MAKKKKSDASEEKVKKKISKEEAEKLIVELAKKGTPSAKIGLLLKEEYGFKRAKYDIGKINKILIKNDVKKFPEELQNLINKAAKLRQHQKANAKDMVSKRGILVTEAKIRGIASYFKKKGMIEKNWEYKAQ